MKIMFVKDLAEARREMKKMLAPKLAIVFRNYNDKTLAAWVPDGYSSGYFVTRNDLKKNPNLMKSLSMTFFSKRMLLTLKICHKSSKLAYRPDHSHHSARIRQPVKPNNLGRP
jgi:hypothetical protein